ncbi:hypothetical protein THRCLA_20336 [Thraustotheca clavata]|uniref:BTB domain-containing protein n=1 Tax=Thraustotheca clavata TaxID=74557 RepID=A0A1W0A8R6_9STRA|nr:hypothetical protein THRCLA_20336 [Thraustotheca clavata]
MHSIVVLDVGGTHFKTTKTTLLKFKGTYFHGLLGSGKWQPQDNGSYFIDLDPECFKSILNYLQLGVISFEDLDYYTCAKLLGSIEYLSIPLPHLVWDPMASAPFACFSRNLRQAQRPKISTTLEAVGFQPCDSYTVAIQNMRVHLHIGFSSKYGVFKQTIQLNPLGGTDIPMLVHLHYHRVNSKMYLKNDRKNQIANVSSISYDDVLLPISLQFKT